MKETAAPRVVIVDLLTVAPFYDAPLTIALRNLDPNVTLAANISPQGPWVLRTEGYRLEWLHC